jgi:chemosensory pili system protein ChpA (sensor histidine kinase/response regulator)
MAERRDYVALDWISGEIDETLNQACQALEAYVKEPADTSKLKFCMSQVSQVQGTLRMVEFHGAALFAHELELLLEALCNDEVIDAAQAHEAIMAGLLYLPGFLLQVRAARQDLPGILLPRINDMRAIRGADLMSELAFFNPELAIEISPSDEADEPGQETFEAELAELRQLFQQAFVGIVRNKQLKQNLPVLTAICQRLQKLSKGKPREALWQVGLAVLEGVSHHTIHPNSAMKSLLKEIDGELKALQQDGVEYLRQPATPEALKTFLYYVARSNGDSPLVANVQSTYQLKQALQQDGQHEQLAIDADALSSVVDALLEELTAIKDYLDLHGRRADVDRSEIKETLPLIKRVGDTMAVLGFVAPLARIREQDQALQEIAAGDGNDSPDALLEVAQAIIAVEQELLGYLATSGVTANSVSEQPHLRGARETVLRETRKGLDQVKEAIIDFVASQWDHAKLELLPAKLHELSGGLGISGLERAARVLEACQCYVWNLLDEKTLPDWQMLEKLADAISGIDYYLERCADDADADNEDILDIAVASVAQLGFPIDELDNMELARSYPVTSTEDAACSATIESQPAPDDHKPAVVEAAVAGGSEVTTNTSGKSLSEDPGDTLDRGEAETAALVSQSEAPASASVAAVKELQFLELEAVIEEPLDEEIAEIFVEEAAEVLQTIQKQLPLWQSQPDDESAQGEIRRAFHTLKGSGRMVGASLLGELAWSIENLLNRVLEHTLAAEGVHIVMVARVTELIPDMVNRFEQRKPVNKAFVDQVMAMAQALLEKEPLAEDEIAGIQSRWLDPDSISSGEQPGVPEIPDSDSHEEPANVDSAVEEATERAALLEIFDAEAQQHLAAMQEFIVFAEQSAEPVLVSDSLQRALHTLKGCARMADMEALVSIVTPLEQLVKQLQAARICVDQQIVEVIRDTTRIAYIGLKLVKETGNCERFSETDALLDRIKQIDEARIPALGHGSDTDTSYLERVGVFMLETSDSLASIHTIIESWRNQNGMTDGDWFIVSDYTSLIASNALELELMPLAELANSWSEAALRLSESEPTEETVAAFGHALAELEGMLDNLAADQSFQELDPGLLEVLENLQPAAVVADSVADSDEPEVEVTATVVDANKEQLAVAADDVDDEMTEMFMEEARDLLENIDETIQQWHEDRGRRSCIELLQRLLHTLKGGARLSGLRSLGNLSHNFETFLTIADEQGIAFDDQLFNRVQRYQDQIVAMVEQVRSGQPVVDIEEESAEALALALKPVEMIDVPVEDQAIVEQARAAAQSAEVSQARVAQEAVKIPAQLIEQLVNLAGETSINRGRVEEQINEVMFSLAEMDATIDRMKEQLRRLDIETEQQLIFRQEQVESQGLEEFDPLEMDRYSVLQQLSRSLQESASDIKEVKGSIFNKSRDMETLLLQQSRINTDLQEGLMRSRMVPFARLVPRLRRIIRQVSQELDKNVNLELLNIEGEMDRTILERMVPSFEHMLRNAVDHGIEAKAERLKANKPAEGNISISLAREAGDVVIILADDGRGISLDAVRRKAIERGMMSADASLSDRETLQFILQPGFSTAQAVTQISGRGVGLDVVASEIKQIGGSVDIESSPGCGTRFIIRLPFTVSVNRALMVQSCGETYAIPLNSIEGIVRVSPFELEAYYQPDSPQFEYAGQSYKLRYLGGLTRSKAVPTLDQETMPLPVMLVRSGENSFAIQVDKLLGSREIVVKTLGPQFSSVQGLSGATVLGDGGVVIILDLHALIRTDISQPLLNELLEEEADAEHVQDDRNLLVMVVDDSVTVRKVTSRFLERNSMDVLLAKDGVDAMQLLQDHKPDVMLLDIEMPRMDGFEVASRVKHSSKLKDLPIIMITSRSGEKHRLRAESIGVDKYLGKPYQEMELLSCIQELTATGVKAAAGS